MTEQNYANSIITFAVIQKCPKTKKCQKDFDLFRTIGQMTEMFQRKKAGEKDEVIDRASACSVIISDHHVLSQYYMVWS